jgi:hypothetical protein
MKRIGKYLVLSIVLLMLTIVYSACEKEVSNQGVVVDQSEQEYLLIEFEHTGCFGTCPIYDIQLLPDGKVYYNGKMYTDFVGEKEGSISQGALWEIYAALEADNIIPVDTSHNDLGIDLPRTKFRYYTESYDSYEELTCMGTCQQMYNERLLIIEEILLKAVVWE